MSFKIALLSLSIVCSTTALFAQKPVASTAEKIAKLDQAKPDSNLAPQSPISNKTANPQESLVKSSTKEVPFAHRYDYFGKHHDYVVRYVQSYFKNHALRLNRIWNNNKSKFKVIDATLAKYNVPKELRYLAVIESALNPNAISPVGAVGTWQFMEVTGKEYGLKISEAIDERTNLAKSSIAAAKYLRNLHNSFKDWLLVVAAYNSGPSPVLRAINKTGSRNFFVIKPHLPRETQGHVLAFIATGTLLENCKQYLPGGKLPDGLFDAPAVTSANGVEIKKPKTLQESLREKFTEDELKQMTIIKVKQPIEMDLMARELSVDKKLLEKWNDDYDLFLDQAYGDEPYALKLPKDKLEVFFDKKNMLEKRSKEYFADFR